MIEMKNVKNVEIACNAEGIEEYRITTDDGTIGIYTESYDLVLFGDVAHLCLKSTTEIVIRDTL